MTILNYTYVDNSNVFIEGQRVSAVKRGMAIDIQDAHDRNIFDYSWQLDYGVLHDIVCGQKSEIGAAKLWGSPPPGDSFWKMIETKGFKVKTYDKSLSGKEKKVDVAIAYEMTKDAYTILAGKQKDVKITLAAGDKDFCPVVEDLRAQGFRVVVAFWGHTAKELRDLATEFFCLDPHLSVLTHVR